MASVSEWIVREYFESMGFLVCQPCKYIPGGHKQLEEEIDLLAVNPKVQDHQVPSHLLWTSVDLRSVARAIIGVYGWHTDRFYPTMLEQIPELLRFTTEEPVRLAVKHLGPGLAAKILCLPQLPASDKLKENTLQLLKQKGVDGVLLFRTMLSELISGIDTHRNYEKSDLLQIIRILKNYHLLRDNQLELFSGHRRKRRQAETDKDV